MPRRLGSKLAARRAIDGGRRPQRAGMPVSIDLRPERDAVGDGRVVEVVGRVVDAGRVAVAEEDVGAGPLLQHEGEILRAHQRRDARVDRARAADAGRHPGHEPGLLRVVAGDRVAAIVLDRRRGPEGRRQRLDERADARLAEVAHRLRQGAHRAEQGRGLRDDVEGLARLDGSRSRPRRIRAGRRCARPPSGAPG